MHLIKIIHHFLTIFLLYFVLFIAELYMQPHFSIFYHNILLYCIWSF